MYEICECPKHEAFDRKYLGVGLDDRTQRKRPKMMEGKMQTCLSTSTNTRYYIILVDVAPAWLSDPVPASVALYLGLMMELVA